MTTNATKATRDTSGCREHVCYCHDDTAGPLRSLCSSCGCRPYEAGKAPEPAPTMAEAFEAMREALRAANDAEYLVPAAFEKMHGFAPNSHEMKRALQAALALADKVSR